MGDNALKGIIVPEGWEVELYDAVNFQGTKSIITGPFAQSFDVKKPAFPADKMSSMIVRKIAMSAVHTSGDWFIAEMSNEEIVSTLTEGVSVSNSKSLSSAESKSVTTSIGVDFWFASSSVQSTVSHLTANTVTSIVSRSQSRTCEASCSNQNNETVALY
jgi:hypothetical protein